MYLFGFGFGCGKNMLDANCISMSQCIQTRSTKSSELKLAWRWPMRPTNVVVVCLHCLQKESVKLAARSESQSLWSFSSQQVINNKIQAASCHARPWLMGRFWARADHQASQPASQQASRREGKVGRLVWLASKRQLAHSQRVDARHTH